MPRKCQLENCKVRCACFNKLNYIFVFNAINGFGRAKFLQKNNNLVTALAISTFIIENNLKRFQSLRLISCFGCF